MSFLEIKCPHCGAKGQIVSPPQEMVFIGPCPRCDELVVLFRDKVVAIDKQILMHGSLESKEKHVYNIVKAFLEPLLGKLSESGVSETNEFDTPPDDRPSQRFPHQKAISQEEISDFINIDLNLIDRKDFFKKTFGLSE